jgi:thiamine-monophosphate kinase
VTVSDLTERQLVSRISERLQPPPEWLLVGIGDDAAVVEPERNRLEVLSVDALVEGVHFDRRFTPPQAIGHRALAINLSDLAAMGASPRLALLSFALPPELSCDDFDAMVGGLADLAALHRLHVIGGNLTRSPGPLLIDVTVAGTVKRRQTLTRSGARPGDEIFVSGALGAAAAGLDVLQRHGPSAPAAAPFQSCVDRYLFPIPRVRLGILLARNRAATACMDLSDGLADAVNQIAAASRVGAVIESEALPVETAARAWFESAARSPDDVVMHAITRGDDYELLFTARPRQRGRLKAALRHADVPLTRIGVCTEPGAVVLRSIVNGAVADRPLPPGYSHFR